MKIQLGWGNVNIYDIWSEIITRLENIYVSSLILWRKSRHWVKLYKIRARKEEGIRAIHLGSFPWLQARNYLFRSCCYVVVLIEVKLTYNIVLFSRVQQSDSVIYFFQIIFHYKLLQVIEYSSLCCAVNPFCLSILYIVVRIC